MPGFDMHIHTTASDGCLSVDDILDLAMKSGLDGIAITDHDTIGGLDRAVKLGHELNYPVIPGIELSTDFQDKEVHILGFLLDYQLVSVATKLAQLQEDRIARIIKIVDKLCHLGYDVDQEEVLGLAGKGSVGRPHIACVLLKKGYVSSMQDAFNNLIGRGCPAYVPGFKLTPHEAIEFIRQAGGIPVIAHPGLSQSEDLIPQLLGHGLMGIEAFHPDHKPEDEVKYFEMAKKLKLVATGGSDFHGFQDGNSRSLGCRSVSSDILPKLISLKKMGSSNETF